MHQILPDFIWYSVYNFFHAMAESGRMHANRQLGMAERPGCELCGSAAVVYCPSDEANLCASCDVRVHSANFIVCRHFRNVLCASCTRPTIWHAYGSRPDLGQYFCQDCMGKQWRGPVETTGIPIHANPRFYGVSTVNGSCHLNSSSDEGLQCQSDVTRVSGTDFEFYCDETCFKTPQATVGRREDESSPVSVLTSGREIGYKRSRDDLEVMSPTCSNSSYGSVASCSSDSLEKGNSSSSQESHFFRKKRVCVEKDGDSDIVAKRESTGSNADSPNILGKQAAARLQRVLSSWYSDLSLTGLETKALAYFVFHRVLKKLHPGRVAADSLRVTLAACLWTAAKLDDKQCNVPKSHEVEAVTGVAASKLVLAEMQLLKILNWRPLEGWIGAGN